MELKLKIVQGKNAGQEVTITGQKFLIGRAEDCHMRPGSDMISRHHCAVVVDQSYVAIRDFGSKNGTYVNGQRVIGECELKSGDQLRVGPLEFEVSLRQGEIGGKKKPPVHSAKEAAERTAQGQPDSPDVSHWLTDPTGEATSAAESRIEASRDTQSIRLTETEQISLSKTRTLIAAQASAQPAAVSAQAAPAPAAPVHATAAQAAPVQPTVAHSAVSTGAMRTVQHTAHPATPAPAATPVAAVRPAVVARPAPVAQAAPAAQPVAAVPPPAAPGPVAAPRGPSVFEMPKEEPAATPDSDKSAHGSKKTYGKLPPRQGTTDSRSAASEVLDKLRKRR
jgi:pSer/pThr/pTyr-binding forkhead associated (FHA) protein